MATVRLLLLALLVLVTPSLALAQRHSHRSASAVADAPAPVDVATAPADASLIVDPWGARDAAAPAPRDASASPSAAPSATNAPPSPAAARRRIYAGVFLHDLIRFDQKAGTFDTEFELWVKWSGDDFDPDRVRVANAADVDRDLIARETEGTWNAARFRVRGTLRGEFPVHRFPFDSQGPSIELELDARDGVLVPDLTSSGMRERFSISGWSYEPRFHGLRSIVRYSSDLGSLAGEGERSVSQRAVFRLTLRRPLVTAALKFFLPLLIILLVAIVAFYLPAEAIDARSSIGVTALLACFAFQFAVSDSMPDVSYMTLADAIFLLSYLCTSIALVVSVVAYDLHRRGRADSARRIDLVARISVPLIILFPAIVLMRAQPDASSHVVAPVPAPAHHRSTRPVLRVGATKLQTAGGGLVGSGAFWTATHAERDDDGPQPWLVEALPELDDDALRLGADGALAVRWHLRERARWSDGTAVTSRDVVFAQQASPAPEISSIESVSEREFIVHYRSRTTSALETFTISPAHALAGSFADGGYDAVRARRRAGNEPALGPYRIASFEADRLMVLEANPHFIGAAPSIPRIEVRAFRDSAALLAALERGEVDITLPNTVSLEEAQALNARRPGWSFVRSSRMLFFLHPDLSVPVLQSPAVRRAIAMAVDRETLAHELFGDTGRAAHAPWVRGIPSGASAYPFDPVEARAMIERAGALGTRLPLRHADDPRSRAYAERVAEMLRATGLEIELVAVRDVADVYRSRRHGGLLLHSADVDDTDHPLRWWNVPMLGRRYDQSARNAALDDSIAALAERYSRTIYRERREALRERLASLANARLPIIPLVFANQRVLADPHLRDWDHGEASDFGEGVDRWYFEE